MFPAHLGIHLVLQVPLERYVSNTPSWIAVRRRRNLEMFLRKFEEILRRGDRGKPPQAKYGGVFEEICGNPETRGQGSDEEIWMILRKKARRRRIF